jgi:hypothetical protein
MSDTASRVPLSVGNDRVQDRLYRYFVSTRNTAMFSAICGVMRDRTNLELRTSHGGWNQAVRCSCSPATATTTAASKEEPVSTDLELRHDEAGADSGGLLSHVFHVRCSCRRCACSVHTDDTRPVAHS